MAQKIEEITRNPLTKTLPDFEFLPKQQQFMEDKNSF
jgi:hypothetical protein